MKSSRKLHAFCMRLNVELAWVYLCVSHCRTRALLFAAGGRSVVCTPATENLREGRERGRST